MTDRVYYKSDSVTLYTGDAVEVLSTLPMHSVHCVVTSPPYWGLRTYGHDQQYGLEATPDAYVNRLRVAFDQLRRVLVDTGTVWLNLGDSYSAGRPGHSTNALRSSSLAGRASAARNRELVRHAGVDRTKALPPKNLLGMPWRVAFALQQDGWLLRNAIVWHKPNAMPESVRDRLSTRYEMLYLLTKQRRYWFDLDPIREPLARPEALHEQIRIGGVSKGRHPGVGSSSRRHGRSIYRKRQARYTTATFPGHRHGTAIRATRTEHTSAHTRGRNPGDVWSISTRPLRAAHFAAFPIDIPLRCIAAGCPNDGVVLDPFSGAGTTGLAALQLGRSYIAIDLNPDFHAIALDRMNDTQTRRRG